VTHELAEEIVSLIFITIFSRIRSRHRSAPKLARSGWSRQHGRRHHRLTQLVISLFDSLAIAT
jgi:hypothetical protein